MSNNQEIVEFVIISFILTTVIFDPRVVLLEEIRCLSLSGVKVESHLCYQKLAGNVQNYVSWFKMADQNRELATTATEL